jgi:hypothetical protein
MVRSFSSGARSPGCFPDEATSDRASVRGHSRGVAPEPHHRITRRANCTATPAGT